MEVHAVGEWVVFSQALVFSMVTLILSTAVIKHYRKDKNLNTESRSKIGGTILYFLFAAFSFVLGWEICQLTVIAFIPGWLSHYLVDLNKIPKKFALMGSTISVGIWVSLVPQDLLIFSDLDWPIWMAQLGSALFLLAIVRAFAFVDGVQGESVTVSVVNSLTLMTMVTIVEFKMALLTFAGLGVGKLLVNLKSGQILLGKMGSRWLGFFLASQFLLMDYTQSVLATILVPLFLFGLPLFEWSIPWLDRLHFKILSSNYKNQHLYHRLAHIGFSSRVILLTFLTVTICCGLAAWTIFQLRHSHLIYPVGILASAGLFSFLGSVIYIDHRQAVQIQNLSQSLIRKHFMLVDKITLDPDNFQVITYDLHNYYKVLQQRGVADIHSFLHDFARLVEELHGQSQCTLVGSYTVLVAEELKQTPGKQWREATESVNSLLVNHKLTPPPGISLGMSFYSSHSRQQSFLQQFSHKLEIQENPSFQLKVS